MDCHFFCKPEDERAKRGCIGRLDGDTESPDIINNLTQQIERSDNRTKERDAKVDYVYGELRKEQAAHLDTVNRLHSSELANKLAEVKRCDVRRCPDRQPPGEF